MDAFRGAPRFLASPRTFSVQSGTNAILKWQVAGEPRPSIVWEKDGSLLELPSSRMFLEVNGDAYSLLVSQAGPADSGRYVCKAKNSVGETYAAALLKVETGSELKPNGDLDCQPPIFLNRPVSACVTRGEDVTFACRVSGQLEWEKDGRRLSDIFESSHYKMDVEPGDWHSLHIYNTRLPDAGVYVCRAQNSFGESMAAAVLLVDPVACLPHNDPSPGAPPNCHFKKPPKSQEEKRHPHHPAQIVLSEGRQNGEMLPSFLPTKSFTVNEGKHAKFRCYVIGKPKPEIVWQKDGKVVSSGRRHLLYEDREGYFILKVLYCTARDCGLYVCTACNAAGQTLSAVRLHVREPQLQFQAPLMDVEVLEHQDAVLECQVPLETMPTAWYLEDKRLQPSPKYLMEEQGLLRRLTVRDARADDDGIYLCEMEGKGRSIGELSVQGLIVKRLPRKLDVMEGENAAFYVETREPVEAPSWGRNGQELVEAPHTLIRSFGKTHILVLVHVSRHDAGVITFMAGDSQTSAQLRVKCAKRIPPSAPVEVKMCTTRSNAALLTWCPPPDLHRSPLSSYILERQTVGEAEWVPCLTTDVASMVEVPGDGVPQEADYRFRVCSANQFGCSAHVEFPGSVHLVPRAHIKEGLQDVTVCINEDATFSVTLSAPMSGCWYLRGKRLAKEEEDQQYHIIHSGVSHTLQVKNVQLAASGSEVRFEANGVKESAVLHVQAPQVHITPVPEARRLRTLLLGMPLLLECELSMPDAPVCWLKDGNPIALDNGACVESEGYIHKLLIPSVCSLDSGTYICDAKDDTISFTVTVEEPPVKIVHSNSKEAHNYKVADRVVLSCELSHPDVTVCWYKDGETVKESKDLLMENVGPHHHLIIPSAIVQDTGEFVCDIRGESVFFNITVTETPVHIIHSSPEEAHTYLVSERVVLTCELSRPNAPMRWYKDGEKVEESQDLLLENEGPHCRLILVSAQVQDTGEFVCDANGDSAFFNITVTEPPVQVVCSNADETHTYWALEQVTLACELSRPNALVHWYKDGKEVEETEGLRLESEGPHHRLIIASAQVQDTGEFVCDAGGDSVFFTVTVSDRPVRIIHSNDEESRVYQVAERIELSCELSRPDAPVHWYKDGEEVEEGEGLLLESEGPHRRLVIPSAQVEDSGEFVCDAGGDSAFFNITVTEPLVQIVQSNAEAVHAYQTSDRVVLTCELSCPNAPVQWYKDGEELEEGEGLLFESEGPHRRLVLPSAQVQDTGEFVCDAGGDSAFFSVTVAAPKVHISPVPEAQCFQTILAGMPLLLECQVSTSDASVQWLKDGEPVVMDENSLIVKSEGCLRRLLINSACPLDSGTYTCCTADETVDFTVTVEEVPVRVVQSTADASHLYQTSERVVLSCELSCPDVAVCWYKDGKEVVENTDFLLENEGFHHRLVIPAAQKHDTGQYMCDAAGNSIFFNVTITEPLVQILRPAERSLEKQVQEFDRLELSCTVSVPDAPVRWFKDGLEVDETHNLVLHTEGAERCLVLLRTSVEDAGEYICETKDESVSFDVMVSEPPISIVGNAGMPEHLSLPTGEDLILACETSSPMAAVRWLRNGKELGAAKRIHIEATGKHQQLTIRSVTQEDSGSYVCDVGTDQRVTAIEVAAPPVCIVNKDDAREPIEVQEGENVTLVAQLSQEKTCVQWLKNRQPLCPGPRMIMNSEGLIHSLTIQQSEPCDCGTFSCNTGDDEVHYTINVQEAPVLFVSKSQHPEKVLVLEGSSAVLSAIVSKESSVVSWEGPRGNLVAGEHCQLRREGRVHSLLLSNVGKADAGDYICHSSHDQLHFELSVKELMVKFVRGLSDVTALQGETVLFWCELCKTKGDVTWLKDGQELEPNEHVEIGSEGRERSLTLSNVRTEDAGEYSCESKDDRTLAILTVQIPRLVEIISELHNLTVLEGDDATFKVVICPDDVRLNWQLNGQDVVNSERLTITKNGLCHTLTIRQCRLSDTGIVTVRAEGLSSSGRLSVQEAQVLFVRTLCDLAAEEGQDVRLEVELSVESAEVQWMKQGILLQQNPRYSMEVQGPKRALTIHHIELADRGTYRCESLHDRTQARLSVEPRKVTVKKPLLDVETLEKETVTFELELSHPNVLGVWTRDGIRVKPSSTCQMSATGCAHSLTLQRLTLDDTGTVAFTADTVRSCARLTVREPPITMLRLPQDLGIPETGSATFECELSRPLAEVKWYKDGKEIQVSPNCRIYSVGRRRLLQLNHCSLEDAGEYMCDAGDCRASAKLRVFERQVQIVRELEDVRVQENENAVFICEVSLGEVKGEWYHNGERLKVTSTVKIRHEGTRHFLLLSSARPEDTGQVRFVAKTAASEAKLEVEALPIRIVKPLRDKTVLVHHKATLECTVSQARGRVRWFRGDTEIFAGPKYEICNLDCYRTLVIHCVEPADEGLYTCDALDDHSTACLLVEAEGIQVVQPLKNVEVMAPSEARFECEISAPPDFTPQWSLNGEELQPGLQVQMESVGHVHKLRFCRTSPNMSGMVKITIGNARSKAHLTVREC
ncbi:obscurin-like protein 1 isoform X5 [Pantherophis guttatus]|uniref:Obscurin-like protein 1 isoform X5 n=1 Tax=Pantherophis guttatus TaxID=94885 RepID=A0ABM3Z641_PANGU|nr:obscurin-like protein 1 isoform X5 [Pantherophis guttatus]